MKERKSASEDHRFTRHLCERIRERKIPAALVDETVRNGKRTVLVSRNAVEHRLKNVLGVRGLNVVVITSLADGAVLTSYVEKIPARYG